MPDRVGTCDAFTPIGGTPDRVPVVRLAAAPSEGSMRHGTTVGRHRGDLLRTCRGAAAARTVQAGGSRKGGPRPGGSVPATGRTGVVVRDAGAPRRLRDPGGGPRSREARRRPAVDGDHHRVG